MLFSCFLFFFLSKKITDKKKIIVKKSPSTVDNIDSNSNTIIHAEVLHGHESDSVRQTNPFDCCSICQNPLKITVADGVECNVDNIVSCRHCLSQTCNSPQCAIWLHTQNRWECSNCHHFDSVVYVQTYDWIFDQLNQRFNDKAVNASVKNTTSINEIDSNLEDDVMLKLNGNLL